jgi:hypothetical protein
MIDYWKEVEFEIHPALNLAASFRQQGMKIAKRGEDARENWSKRRSEASNSAGWQICLIPICIPRYAMVAIVLPP